MENTTDTAPRKFEGPTKAKDTARFEALGLAGPALELVVVIGSASAMGSR